MPISPLFAAGPGLAGGLLIGAASSAHLALNGRISGFSGIIHGAMTKQPKTRDWRLAFLSGTLSSGIALHTYFPQVYGNGIPVNAASVFAAGALVGFGTQMGSGCTSGHGVCGLPRLSPRSITAVGTFMTTGMLTRAVVVHNDWMCRLTHHSTHFDEMLTSLQAAHISPTLFYGTVASAFLGMAVRGVQQGYNGETYASTAAGYGSGALFGVGLGVAQMTDPSKVLSFLDIAGVWDPSLAFVMGGAVGLNLFTFRSILRRRSPMLFPTFGLPTKKDITSNLVIGSGIFGIGWGLGGVCPGPGLLGLTTGDPGFTLWFLSLLGGMSLWRRLSTSGLFRDRTLFSPKAAQAA